MQKNNLGELMGNVRGNVWERCGGDWACMRNNPYREKRRGGMETNWIVHQGPA